jgi:putative phosphoesterase
MRFAVISDIHSNLHALQAVLADIEDRGLEHIYCLGDVVAYAAYPNEVVEILRKRGIKTVQGNCDRRIGEGLPTAPQDFPNAEAARLAGIFNDWTIDIMGEANKQWLANLPLEVRFMADDLSVLMVHGSPRRINEGMHGNMSDGELVETAGSAGFDILLCGHTHAPYHRLIEGRHYINPGSVGKPKHGNDNPVYAIVDVVGRKVAVTTVEVPYNIDEAAEAIIAAGMPEHFALDLKR